MNNANNKNCGSCSKQNCPLKCSQCLVQYYCSSKCQKEHWKLHKSKCIKKDEKKEYGGVLYDRSVVLPESIKKTEPDEMIRQLALNNNSMKLAYQYVGSKSAKRDIMIEHENGNRCFINVELVQITESEKPEVEGFPYKIIRSSIETDSINYKTLVGSEKLDIYTGTYDKSNHIPLIIWCRDPYCCYTALIMQPWKTDEYLKNK